MSRRKVIQTEVPIVFFRDLLIILDSSGSIGFRDYVTVKDQLVADPFYLTVNKANNRAALIHFSEKFKVIEEFDFDDNLNLSELKPAIISVPYKTTCTGDAFHVHII